LVTKNDPLGDHPIFTQQATQPEGKAARIELVFPPKKWKTRRQKSWQARIVGRKSSREITFAMQSVIFGMSRAAAPRRLFGGESKSDAYTLRQNHTAAFLLIKMNIHCGGAQLFHLADEIFTRLHFSLCYKLTHARLFKRSRWKLGAVANFTKVAFTAVKCFSVTPLSFAIDLRPEEMKFLGFFFVEISSKNFILICVHEFKEKPRFGKINNKIDFAVSVFYLVCSIFYL